MEIKKNIPNNTITRKLVDLDKETGNIYETVNIIARRANQISTELKTELSRKLADFSSPTDTMEETFENREQIEISRYYERLPKPAIIATEEGSSTANSSTKRTKRPRSPNDTAMNLQEVAYRAPAQALPVRPKDWPDGTYCWASREA